MCILPVPVSSIETIVFMLFSQKDIQAGLPWAVLDAQGNHNTIYVSSFGSFESVLAVYEYGNMLENTTQVRKLLVYTTA